MKERIKVWTDDKRFIQDQILSLGLLPQVEESRYTENDFLIDFFRETGLWELLIGSRPLGLKKENGYPWEVLQQIGIFHELSQAGRLIKITPLISDGRLMATLGFNLTYLHDRKKEEKGVIHPDTLRNHYKRKGEQQSIRDFYQQVAFLRENKWLRGGIYAADGFKIVVHGKTFEGMGRVFNDDTKRWESGYKAVLLMNVEKDRERLCGIAVGPIQMDERKLLRKILKDLKKHVCLPSQMIDLLILDRGFWGTDFLGELKEEWGIDFLIMAKKNLEIVRYEIPAVAGDLQWHQRVIEEKDERKKITKRKVEVAKYEGIGFRIQREKGPMTAVIERNPKDKTNLTIFLTTRQVKDPLTPFKQYSRRWAIENEGIRELSQKHKVRELGGRTLDAITARLSLCLMTYNALKIFRMKWERRHGEMKRVMRQRRHQSYLQGDHQVVAYSGDRFATFAEVAFSGLCYEGGQRDVLRKVAPVLERAPPEIRQNFDLLQQEILKRSEASFL